MHVFPRKRATGNPAEGKLNSDLWGSHSPANGFRHFTAGRGLLFQNNFGPCDSGPEGRKLKYHCGVGPPEFGEQADAAFLKG
jgi:hypothetical protein